MSQMQVILQRQDALEQGQVAAPQRVTTQLAAASKLPSVSAALLQEVPNGPAIPKTLALVGPPPKVRHSQAARASVGVVEEEPQDVTQPQIEESTHMLTAINQQSAALTALVAHLTSAGSDAMHDLSGLGVGGLHVGSTKGVQRREKMQNELACGTSQYFIQVLQQLHRRMHPSRPIPQREEELAQVSMLSYLERHGGYKHNRELGLVAWIVGHCMDAAAQGDLHLCRELLALLMVGVEQASVDRGDWSLAYLLTLVEEPPPQLYQDRSSSLAFHARPFGPLVPPAWTANVLSYLKDLEVLSTRKGETTKKQGPKASPKEDPSSEGGEASPKRKPRFPKRPKAKAIQDAPSGA
eukprot:Skav206050  [mRNA]  locus=scaffold587:261914:262972:+ [translate_table: standard]